MPSKVIYDDWIEQKFVEEWNAIQEPLQDIPLLEMYVHPLKKNYQSIVDAEGVIVGYKCTFSGCLYAWDRTDKNVLACIKSHYKKKTPDQK
jgi:hypothetical protein